MKENSPLRILALAGKRLEKAGIENAQNEARFIMLHVMETDIAELFRNSDIEMPIEARQKFEKMIVRREKGCPISYILGSECFMGLWFDVDTSVLIPRQDTEILVKETIAFLKERSNPRVLDLCCGSGAVGIVIAHYKKDSSMVLSDISEECVRIAKRNAEKNGVSSRVSVRLSDLFTGIEKEEFDTIACNPPYIDVKEMEELDHQVRDYEPRLALFGGQDGLFFYKTIIPKAKEYLKVGGALFLEIGQSQSTQIAIMLRNNGYENIYITKDNANRPRVVSGRKTH